MSARKSSSSKSTKTKETSFSAANFGVMAAPAAVSVDVSGVTGSSGFGKSTNYTAHVNATLTEAANATVNVALASEVTSSGHSLSLPTASFTVASAADTQSVVNELLGVTLSSGEFTDSGSLALVSSPSAAVAGTIVLDVEAGTYTLTDDGVGVLSAAGLPVSGTANYATGAWTVDFTNLVALSSAAISGSYDITYPWNVVSQAVVIRHTVGPDADINGTASAVLSASVSDVGGISDATSLTFTLSTTRFDPDNPWKGRGALPGETTLETAGRFVDEGII